MRTDLIFRRFSLHRSLRRFLGLVVLPGDGDHHWAAAAAAAAACVLRAAQQGDGQPQGPHRHPHPGPVEPGGLEDAVLGDHQQGGAAAEAVADGATNTGGYFR